MGSQCLIDYARRLVLAAALFSGLLAGAPACSSQEASPAPSANRISGKEVIHQLSEQFLQEMVLEERFSGVALVMRGDDVVHARAYGPAGVEAENRLDTVFHVGSVTKQFTAAAIMQLVERNAIDLDGPINNYLPARYRSDNWSPVKVRHLLSHTGGVPDYAEARDYYDVVDGWAFGDTVDGMIREAMAKPLDFEPDANFYYSNIGFTLLGAIIEEQSGKPYAEFMQDNVLRPVGMADSRIHVAGHEARPDEASGLRWDDEKRRHVKDDIPSLPVTPPDGGLATTLDDFVKWISVYRNMAHPNLSAASLERMMKPSIPAGSYLWPQQGLRGEASYGFGLAVSGDLIMHEGYIVGFRSHFIYSRDDDLLVVVFANNTRNDPFRLSSGLFALHQ